MTLAVVFALVTEKNLKKMIAGCHAHEIAQVPEQLLEEWNFVLASNRYKQFYLSFYFPKYLELVLEQDQHFSFPSVDA